MADDQEQLIARVFAEEVPQIAAGVVEIRAIARIAGVRSRLAVSSNDPRVDAVGVCMGERIAARGPSAFNSCRITRILDRLGGERIEIVRWSDSPETLIANALVVAPERIEQMKLLHAEHRAVVIVKDDLLNLLEGPRGENWQLACRLSGWEIKLLVQ